MLAIISYSVSTPGSRQSSHVLVERFFRSVRMKRDGVKEVISEQEVLLA